MKISMSILRRAAISAMLIAGFGLAGLGFARSTATARSPETGEQEASTGTQNAANPEAASVTDHALRFILLASGVENEKAGQAMLGVHVRQADETLRQQLGIAGKFGLVIEHVNADSGAAKAGLQVHDVLLKLNDQILANHDQFQSLIDARKPGDRVRVEYMRQGTTQKASIQLTERQKIDVASAVQGLEKHHASLLGHAHWEYAKLQNCAACHNTTVQWQQDESWQQVESWRPVEPWKQTDDQQDDQ